MGGIDLTVSHELFDTAPTRCGFEVDMQAMPLENSAGMGKNQGSCAENGKKPDLKFRLFQLHLFRCGHLPPAAVRCHRHTPCEFDIECLAPALPPEPRPFPSASITEGMLVHMRPYQIRIFCTGEDHLQIGQGPFGKLGFAAGEIKEPLPS